MLPKFEFTLYLYVALRVERNLKFVISIEFSNFISLTRDGAPQYQRCDLHLLLYDVYLFLFNLLFQSWRHMHTSIISKSSEKLRK